MATMWMGELVMDPLSANRTTSRTIGAFRGGLPRLEFGRPSGTAGHPRLSRKADRAAGSRSGGRTRQRPPAPCPTPNGPGSPRRGRGIAPAACHRARGRDGRDRSRGRAPATHDRLPMRGGARARVTPRRRGGPPEAADVKGVGIVVAVELIGGLPDWREQCPAKRPRVDHADRQQLVLRHQGPFRLPLSG